MDFLKGEAEKYLGGSGGASGGGGDMSQLGNLAGLFKQAEGQSGGGGGLDVSTFKSFLGGGDEANAGQAAKQQGADPSAIDTLLSKYTEETGSSFGSMGGDIGEASKLADFAKNYGVDVPPSVLEKLVKWKMEGHF